jgi:hypothetical protein
LNEFFRIEKVETLENICTEISEFNVRFATTTLLELLWKKLYSNKPVSMISSIGLIYTDYWGTRRNTFPYGSQLPMDDYVFLNTIKCNVEGDEFFIAADFAIRFTCAGVTECGVERHFTYLKWLVGSRRIRLNKESLYILSILKYSKDN